MKKRIIIITLLIISLFTACGSKGYKNKFNRSAEDLLEGLVEVYLNADIELANDLFPPFYIEKNKEIFNKERIIEFLEDDMEKYGYDFDLSYKLISQTKLSGSQLKSLNKYLTQKYGKKAKASKCYSVEAKLYYIGSKKDKTETINYGYCKFGLYWYLING